MDIFSRCHPSVSFTFFLGAIGGCVIAQHPAYLLVSLAAALIYACLLNGRRSLRLAAALAPFVFMITLINPFFSAQGQHVLFYLFSRPYTLEALLYGALTGVMLLATGLWFSCYSQVMTSDKFTSLFAPIVPSVSLLLVMVLRMIPRLSKKAKQISTARECIGKGGRNLAHGARILSAVTDDALEGSITTADSMRARGYGSAKRTSFRLYRMRNGDWLLLGLLFTLLACAVIFGRAQVVFYPTVQIQNISWGFAAYSLYVLLPTVLYCKEAIRWRILRSKI